MGLDDLANRAGVKGVGEGDEGVAADLLEFVAKEADGLALGGIIFERGDNEVEAAVAVEVLRSDVAAIFRQG